MSSIVTDHGIVHRETFGSGRPVILLHDWIESWGLWQPTMEALGRDYRCCALDFWGFGESGKKRASHAVGDYMQLVRKFIDVPGIAQAPLVGHSLGGTAGQAAVVRNPDGIEILPNSGHFPMLDELDHHLSLIRSFLEQPPPQN